MHYHFSVKSDIKKECIKSCYHKRFCGNNYDLLVCDIPLKEECPVAQGQQPGLSSLFNSPITLAAKSG